MDDLRETMINLLEGQRRTLAAMLDAPGASPEQRSRWSAEIAELEAELAVLRDG